MAIPYSRTIFAGIPWYSALIVSGILVAIFLGEREERRLALPKDTVIDLALVAVPCGIVGARLYYVAMTWEYFAPNPISILYIWEGGIAIYGAIIGGALGAWIYARRKKLSFPRLLDALIPGVLLAQAIGRWGNYFNMEAYGPPILNPAFQFFPAGVLIASPNGYVWHMATFFYESLWNFCGFIVLWLMRKKQRRDGDTFCWYLLIYGSGRFIIEQLREDSLYLGGVRVSQMLSLALCAAAACILLWRTYGARPKAFAVATVAATALLGRWFCLQSPWSYGVLLGLGLGGCVLLARMERKNDSSSARSGSMPLLLVPLLLEVGAGVFAVLPSVSISFAGRLHTLICSLTLPLLIGWMAGMYSPVDAKEVSRCR